MKKAFFSALTAALFFVPQITNAQTFGVTTEASEQNTPTGWTAVVLPQLPDITSENTFNITDYGATTESADNTDAIQKACDAVTSAGGAVVIPEGTWLCGKIRLKSKTILHLAKGATLKVLDYKTYQAKYNNDGHNFIENNRNASDIIIEGEDSATSVIDGQGSDWWRLRDEGSSDWDNLKRGTLIRLSSGDRFLIKNLKFQNAPGVNVTCGQSGRGSNFTVHDIQILEPASTLEYIYGRQYPSHNTDGISMWAPYVNIYNCYISNGDDNVVVDSNGQYIHVWNCTFGTGHGASIGSYTSNVHDVIYENLTFNKTEAGFKIKSSRGRSGSVYNIIFRNSTMNGVLGNNIGLSGWYGNDSKQASSPATAASQDSTSTTPYYHDILIQNITSTGTPYNKRSYDYFPIYIFGLPESYVSTVTFDNVNLSTQKKMYLAYCRGINFVNGCKINGTELKDASVVKTMLSTECKATYTVNAKSTVDPTPDPNPGTEIGAELVTLSSATTTSSKGDDPYVFNDGYTISNDKGKGYGAGKEDGIKYSASVQYAINLPAGVSVGAVKFKGYDNYDGTDSYLSELNGTTYGETDYVFPQKDGDGNYTVTEHTVILSQPATGTLTFTFKGKQVVEAITLYAPSPTGISSIAVKPNTNSSDAWYSLDGKQLKGTPSQHGIYIHNGKKLLQK